MTDPLPPYWPRFIEKLLLAVIDAHPPATSVDLETNRQRRLNDALRALTGEKPKRGKAADYDLPELMRMAEKLQIDAMRNAEDYLQLPGAERTPKLGARTVAARHRRSAGPTGPDSHADRLRRKLRDPEVQRYLWAALNDAMPAEGEMHQDLRTIQRILKRWGTQMEVDVVKLGMASEWDKKHRK